GNRHRNENQSPSEVAQRHIRSLDQPREQHGDPESEQGANSRDNNRCPQGLIKERHRVGRDIILQRPTFRNRRMTRLKTADEYPRKRDDDQKEQEARQGERNKVSPETPENLGIETRDRNCSGSVHAPSIFKLTRTIPLSRSQNRNRHFTTKATKSTKLRNSK